MANLIKIKRYGNIKGWTCENGSLQKRYLKEDESIYSPTRSTESLMSTLFINATKHRNVAVFDVTGDYLQTDMPSYKQILLCIIYKFVDIMCGVNPDYKTYVKYDNGKKVLCVKVLRAIYGCIESALLC